MITKKLLNYYIKYNGDLDSWSRTLFAKQELYKDWYLIGSIIQDLELIRKDIASEEYRKKVENILQQNCDDKETIAELLKIGLHR